MIRLFASDLDGTLLNIRHQTDSGINANLARVIDAGRIVVLATGRNVPQTSALGFGDLPLIAAGCNGALIYQHDGTLLRKRELPQQAFAELLEEFPNVLADYIGPEGTYTRQSASERQAGYVRPPWYLYVLMRKGMKRARRMLTIQYEQTPNQLLDAHICKANIHVETPSERTRLERFLEAHKEQLVNASFNGDLFEITEAHTNKGEAVAWVAAQNGISEDDVCVYGDGGNDVAMLSRFSSSYCPKNAIPSARKAAHYQLKGLRYHAVSRHMVRVCTTEGPLA